MNNIKVVHFSTVHQPYDIRIFHKECKTLAKYGYQVIYIVPAEKDESIDAVYIKALKKPNKRWERFTITYMRLLIAALKEKAIIYHFHDPELIPLGLLLKMFGKRVIYDVHEDMPRDIQLKEWIPRPFRKIVACLFEKFENFSAKRFDTVVAATPVICNRFSLQGCEAVNINNYPINGELHSPGVRWESKESSVCYVGGINGIRGLFNMIEAAELADVMLILGGEYFYEDERLKAMGMSGWNKVVELGHLNRKEVADTLNRSMAGLVVLNPIKSFIDSLPIKLFEYMSAGIPVIASDFPIWKEIITDSQCGICVDPLNPNDIANAVKWIISHPLEAEKMGNNGRLAIQEKYNWDIESKVLLGVYKELSV
ncbi:MULTISPECIES: glycosyltransferase family 4 protein [unclassified Paenibacillus]|uniref:glycosyltransferase family 4 protein n=1 Tax=unclassified Paenibacillus TaxID=185978 RepID=UPI00363254A6